MSLPRRDAVTNLPRKIPSSFIRRQRSKMRTARRKSSPVAVNLLTRISRAMRFCNAMRRDQRVTVMTAAMCQGNKLEPVREEFPARFFDVGICESHAVAFAAGQAKTGLKPIVTIYSTFLQRSYDQIFQK